MKISKTPEGQLSIDLFDRFRSPKGRIIGFSAGAVVLLVIPAIVFMQQMSKFGLGMSALLPSPKAEQATPTNPTPSPAVKPVAVAPVKEAKKNTVVIRDYKAGLGAIEGMDQLVSDIRLGLTDYGVDVEVTTYFEVQPKPMREEMATNLWRAWVVSSDGHDTNERFHMRLLNSSGRTVGGTKALTGAIYVED